MAVYKANIGDEETPDWRNACGDPSGMVDTGVKNFFWKPNASMMQSYDAVTDTLRALLPDTPGIPYSTNQFGSANLLGSGEILVNATNLASQNTQDGFTVDENLSPAASARWTHDPNTFWPFRGYSSAFATSAQYDDLTALNWSTVSVPGTPWSLYGYDNLGNFVQGIGDTSIDANGDSYIGADGSSPPSVSIYDRWIYRAHRPMANGLLRYNFSTEEWQSAFTFDRRLFFIGVDPVSGLVIFATLDTNQIEVHSPDDIPWTAVGGAFPNQVGLPLRTFDPLPTAVPGGFAWLAGEGDCVEISGGKAYYVVQPPSSTYGVDATIHAPFGDVLHVYSLDLTTGVTDLILTVPHRLYDSVGNEVATDTDPNYFTSNSISSLGSLAVGSIGAAPIGLLKVNIGDEILSDWRRIHRTPGDVGALKINIGDETSPNWVRACPHYTPGA